LLYSISGANLTWLLPSISKLYYFLYFKCAFLEIQASAYMVGFPKLGHIYKQIAALERPIFKDKQHIKGDFWNGGLLELFIGVYNSW